MPRTGTSRRSYAACIARCAPSTKFAGHQVHDWVLYDPDQETYEKWEVLPLIVLAGLR
jgi:hypothetical protein